MAQVVTVFSDSYYQLDVQSYIFISRAKDSLVLETLSPDGRKGIPGENTFQLYRWRDIHTKLF